MGAGNESEFIDHLQGKEKEGKVMKCPLLIIGYLTVSDLEVNKKSECIKEGCACWDRAFERCDPTGLVHTLERLTDELAEIQRKMLKGGE